MLIDFDKYCEKITDKILFYFNVESDPLYSERARKFFRWFGYKLIPFILNIASFFILLTIFNRIAKNYGMTKLLVLFMTIYVMNMRVSNKNNRKI